MLEAVGEYGKIRTYMNSAMGVCLGLIFLVVGFFMEKHKAKYNVRVDAKVKSVGRCSLTQDSNNPPRNVYSCSSVQVEYKDPNDTLYKPGPIVVRSSRVLSPGNVIPLFLNKKDFSDFSQTSDDSRMMGLIFICLGLFIGAASIASVYFVNHSKIAAEVSGAEGIADAIGIM